MCSPIGDYMRRKSLVSLTPEQRQYLLRLVLTGNASARKLTRARILLRSDTQQEGGPWADEEIARALDISPMTARRVRQVFAREGLDAAIEHRQQRRTYSRKLDENAKAILLALFHVEPPQGRSKWSAQSLADRMIQLGYISGISRETVRKALKEQGVNL